MSGEKTLEPSKKKMDDSRKEGQVATSTDFLRTATAIVTFEGSRHLVTRYSVQWSEMLQAACDYVVAISHGRDWSTNAPIQWITISLVVSAAFLTAVVFVWTMLSWMQTKGPVILEHPIAFKIEKLDPSNYFKNVFSMKTLTTFGGNVFKSTLLSGIFIYAVFATYADFHHSLKADLPAMLTIVGDRITHFVRLSLWLMLAISTADIWIQIKMLRKTLKMSHQDMKEEHKGMEGNAEVKQQVREIGSQMLEEGMPDPLQGSNALIVNPTHIAIGLYFAEDVRALPFVRVKKVEQAATGLIETAQAKNVPVIRHLWLARTLFECPVGKPVPRETYRTVAAIYKVIINVHAAERSAAMEIQPNKASLSIPR